MTLGIHSGVIRTEHRTICITHTQDVCDARITDGKLSFASFYSGEIVQIHLKTGEEVIRFKALGPCSVVEDIRTGDFLVASRPENAIVKFDREGRRLQVSCQLPGVVACIVTFENYVLAMDAICVCEFDRDTLELLKCHSISTDHDVIPLDIDIDRVGRLYVNCVGCLLISDPERVQWKKYSTFGFELSTPTHIRIRDDGTVWISNGGYCQKWI
jgi:hypothetical protein